MEQDNTSENRDYNLEKPGYLLLNRFQIYTVSLEASSGMRKNEWTVKPNQTLPFSFFVYEAVQIFTFDIPKELFLSDATSIKVPPQIPMTAKVLCDCVLTAGAFYMFSQILRIPKTAKLSQRNTM